MLIPIPSVLDKRTGRLVSKFENEDSTGKYTAARFVAQCVLSCGLQPSYAFATAPMAQFGPGAYDQRGLKVALKRTGPAGKLKLLTRAEIAYEEYGSQQQARLMTGWLVSNAHQFSMREDSVVMQVFDDKIILDKFTVSGCLVYDPVNKYFYWDLDRPCIFNYLGWPNFIDSPLGPVFAPSHRYGYADSFKQSATSDQPALDNSEPAKGLAFFRARSADCDDAIKYLRLVHFLDTRGGLPPMPVDVGLVRIPFYINWPESLGNLDGFTRRKLKHENMQGLDGKGLGLGQALQQIARKAGAYDLYMKPTVEFRSEISFVDLNPGRDTGIQLLLPDYDPGIRNCFGSMVIKEGHVIESAVDYFHETCGEGDSPSVEMGLYCKGFFTGGYDFQLGTYGAADGLEEGLEPAWSNIDDFLARAYVAANQGAGPSYSDFGEAMLQAFDLYPWWLCAYRCKLGFNPWTGTKWDGMKNGGRIRFKPFLNTGYQMDSQSPQNWQPRRIVFEKYVDQTVEVQDASNPDPDPPLTAAWVRMAAGTADGLTLSADSTVFIISSARSDDTWVQINHKDAAGDPIGTPIDNVVARPMRACAIALQADWPITGRGKDDPNDTVDRVSQFFKYCWRVKSPPGDYQELLRRGDSYPVGKAGFPGSITTAFQPHCTKGNELFTDRVDENTGILPEHYKVARLKDVKRIAYYAKVRIPKLCPALRPGLTISIEGKDTIKCKTVIKSVVFSMVGTTNDPKENPAVPDTCVEAGPPDFAVLMPGEGKGIVATTSGGDSGYQPGEKKDPYEQYSHDVPTTKTPETTAAEPKRPQDNYEKEDAKERGVQPPAPAQAQHGELGAAASATRKSTRSENIKAAMEARSETGNDKGYDRDMHRMERDLRKADKAQLGAAEHAANKKAQRTGGGTINGAHGDLGEWLGKPNHGSMTDASGRTHESIMGKGAPGFGEAGSGRMGNVEAGHLGEGMFDTSKSDKFDSDNYKSVAEQHTANSFDKGGVDAFIKHQMTMAGMSKDEGEIGMMGAPPPKPPNVPAAPAAPAAPSGSGESQVGGLSRDGE